MAKTKRGNPQLELHRNTDTTAAQHAKAENSLYYSIYVVITVFEELDQELCNLSDSPKGHAALNILSLGITKAGILQNLNEKNVLMPRREWDRRKPCQKTCNQVRVEGYYKPATQEGLTRALRGALKHVEEVAPKLRNRYSYIHARETEEILQVLLY